MKLERVRPLEHLADGTRCLAAVFTTYTFDPTFFEQQVLPTVLHLVSDPVEQPARFLDEARRVLQEVPIACLADADMRPPGHRLPYDLLEVRGRTFHPKLVLLVHDEFARLQVSSGNLTRSGYGGNTEIFFSINLRYDDAGHVAVLRDVDSFLEAAERLTRSRGDQLEAVRDAVRARLTVAPAADASPFRFLHSEGAAPILEQFLALLPEGAKVTRIGALAPFWELDDVDGGDDSSVIGRLGQRLEPGCPIDLGVLWDDNPIAKPPAEESPDYADRLGTLWARLDEVGNVSYFVPTNVTASQLHLTDDGGVPRRLPRREADEARTLGRSWPVTKPRVFAPARIIAALRESAGELRTWLHPAWSIQDGRRTRRPLHAKLLVVTVRRRGTETTFALVGSPNLSKKALVLPPPMGNVEAAVAFAVDGAVALPDFVDRLVFCGPGIAEFAERTFPELATGYGRLVECVVLEAATRTLRVTWAVPEGEPARQWELLYEGRSVATGDSWPGEPTLVTEFDLSPGCCELVLRCEGRDSSIPIIVLDLHALPTGPASVGLELRELLALLGRRLGGERLLTLRAERDPGVADAVLDAILGEGFGPTDVFRAWWSIADDLRDPNTSVQGTRLMLEGALGARAVWGQMLKHSAKEGGILGRDEAWFYGSELLRTFREVVFDGPQADAKTALLADFVSRVSADLEPLAPRGDGWVEHLRRFYAAGSAR